MLLVLERSCAPGRPNDPKSSEDKYGPMKVSDLPIVHDTAQELGRPNSMDYFIQHVDRQIAQGKVAPKNDPTEKAKHKGQTQFAPKNLLMVRPPQYAPGHPGNPNQQKPPPKNRAILRPDGWIESRPGDIIDIPLQTASPNIPKEIIDYFEKSRKADL